MKTGVLFLFPAVWLLLLASCRPGQDYSKYTRELDSLKIVTEQAVDHFNAVDSLVCYEAYNKQHSYRIFVESHVKDTVSKEAAECLAGFFSTEPAFKDYITMRAVWLSEARSVIRQNGSLSHDLKNGSVEPSDAVEFISNEKRQSEKIIEELKTNTVLIRKHIELYLKCLPAVEEVLKAHNSGLLPAVVKPESRPI